jgi:hypothetical protein
MSYKTLRESFPEHMIETAIACIKACAEDVGVTENYEPDVQSVAAVCIAMQESYRQGYADCYNKGK